MSIPGFRMFQLGSLSRKKSNFFLFQYSNLVNAIIIVDFVNHSSVKNEGLVSHI